MEKNRLIKKYEIINIIEGFLYNLCVAVSPIFLYLFLKEIQNRPLNFIYAISYIVSLFLQILLGYLDMRILWKYEKSFKNYYLKQINHKFTKIDFRKSHLSDGEVISLINNVNDFHAYKENKLMLIRYSLAFIIYAVALSIFMKAFAGIILGILAFIFLISKIFDKRLVTFREKYIEEKARLMSKIRNKLQNYDFFTHRVFWPIMEGFKKDFNTEARVKKNNDVLLNISKACNDFLTDLYKVLNILLCFIAVSESYFTLFFCLIGYQLSKYLSELFNVIANQRNTVKNYSGALKELKEYFCMEENSGMPLDCISEIKFQNAKVVKENFELTINADFDLHKKYFLSGANGSGKTTFCNVLASLEAISEGEILYDTVNYLNYKSDELCYVCSAEPLVYEGNLLDNVTMYQTLSFDGSKLNSLIKQRYKILCSHNNSTDMSGGEKQFVSFLRSLDSTAQIVIYDEAFSQIDEGLRAAIYDYINQLDRCVLVIDHKIKTPNGYEKLQISGGELRHE